MADEAATRTAARIIPPEQGERARRASRLTSARRRIEKFRTGEPEPTPEDLWTLAVDAVAGWAPPTPEIREWLRRMLDMSGGADGT